MAVAESTGLPTGTVEDGWKSKTGIVLLAATELSAEVAVDWFPLPAVAVTTFVWPVAVESTGPPTGTVDEGWKSKAGMVLLATAELSIAVTDGRVPLPAADVVGC